MNYQLKNKKAFITGSTSGIGWSIANMLSAEGANVILNGRTSEGIASAIKKIKETNPASEVKGLIGDFSQPSSVQKLMSQLEDVDILINNVGIFTSQTFSETSDDDWYRLFEVNVMSGVRLSRQILPVMLKKGWGRIIFISSECAQLVPEDLIAYSTTKAALHSISRGLAQLTKGTQVTVNTVMPGSTLSEGASRFLKEQSEKQNTSEETVAKEFFSKVRTTSLLARFASTDEIAHLVTFLASPLSSATNGAVLKADGGSVPGIF